MPPALSSLKYKAARSTREKHLEQGRGGNMDVGADSQLLQMIGLIGPASGDDREWGLNFFNYGKLLLPKLRRHESKNAHSP